MGDGLVFEVTRSIMYFDRANRCLKLAALLLVMVIGGCQDDAPSQGSDSQAIDPPKPSVSLAEQGLRKLVGEPPQGAAKLGVSVMSHSRGRAAPTNVWIANTCGRFKRCYLRVEEPLMSNRDGQQALVQPLRAAVATHMVVKVHAHVSESALKMFARARGYSIEPMKTLNTYRVHFAPTPAAAQERAPRAELLPNALMAFQEASMVIESAEPDVVLIPLDVATAPSDPNVPAQLWGLHNFGQTLTDSSGFEFNTLIDADMDVPQAWSQIAQPSPVTIAVIDTGVDYCHPEFLRVPPANGRCNATYAQRHSVINTVLDYDFYDDDDDAMDEEGHGTHVSGTIAASRDKSGVVGIANQVNIIPIRFLGAGGGLLSDAIDAINYVTQLHRTGRANILLSSNSWGGGDFSELLRRAIAQAGNPTDLRVSPILFVAAAGNENNDNDAHPNYPSSYEFSDYGFDNVISVGASTPFDTRAAFSNYGAQSVDVFAPGETIYSSTLNGERADASGTSMATPAVSAVAVLIKQRFGAQISAQDIKARLLRAVDPKPGLQQARSRGRLNAAYAVSDRALLAIDAVVDDSVTLQPNTNNGNGLPDIGELVKLKISVRNGGALPTTLRRITLRSMNPGVADFEGPRAFVVNHALAAWGGTAQLTQTFTVRIKNQRNLQVAYWIADLEQSDSSTVKQAELMMPIMRPVAAGSITLDQRPWSGAAVQLEKVFEMPFGLPSASVLVAQVKANAQGLYALSTNDKDPLTYRVRIDHAPSIERSDRDAVFNGTTPVTINVRYKTASVRGTVKDGQTQQPLALAQLMFETSSRKTPLWTDRNGNYVFSRAFSLDTPADVKARAGISDSMYQRSSQFTLRMPTDLTQHFTLARSPYRLMSLRGAFPQDLSGSATAINEKGQATGWVTVPQENTYERHAFLFTDVDRNGVAEPNEGVPIRADGYGSTAGLDVNDEGVVVGQAIDRSKAVMGQGFVHLPGDPKARLLGVLGRYASDVTTANSVALGVNNQGVIVGSSTEPQYVNTGFMIVPQGVGANRVWYQGPTQGGAQLVINTLMRNLSTGVAVTAERADDINDAMEVFGVTFDAQNNRSAPFYLKANQLPTLISGLSDTATSRDFSENGTGVGRVDWQLGFVWQRTSAPGQPLRGAAVTFEGQPIAVNNLGELVGMSTLLDPADPNDTDIDTAQIWTTTWQGQVPVSVTRKSLDDMLPVGVHQPAQFVPQDINDCGAIAGYMMTQGGDGSRSDIPLVLLPVQNRKPTFVNADPDPSANDTVLITTQPTVVLPGSFNDCTTDGQAPRILWEQKSGPARATFSDVTTVRPQVRLSVRGRYVFRITVRDGALSAFDDVTVTY